MTPEIINTVFIGVVTQNGAKKFSQSIFNEGTGSNLFVGREVKVYGKLLHYDPNESDLDFTSSVGIEFTDPQTERYNQGMGTYFVSVRSEDKPDILLRDYV